jgi:hypothetical protein
VNFARASARCAPLRGLRSKRGWMVVLLVLTGCPRPEAAPFCFDIEGGGTHDSLQDAIDLADPGGTIRVCGGVSSGEVVIDKDLTLEGKENEDSVFLSEGDAITIRNADVTIERLIIRAAEDAIQVFDGALTFQGGAIDESGGVAMETWNSDVRIRYAEIEDSVLGGVRLHGGTLDMNHVDVARINSYGVMLDGGVTAVIDDSTFSDIYYTGNASYLFTADGLAVQTQNQDDLTITASSFDGISIAAVQVENGKARIDGTTMSNVYAGVLALAGDITMTDVQVENPQRYGIYSRMSTFDLTDSSFLLDPEGDLSSIGIIALGSDLTMSGGTISGGNLGGIYARALNDVTNPDVVLDSVLVDDNALCAVAVETGALTATDTTISNTRDRDDSCDPGVEICNAALCLAETGVIWTGGGVTDSESMVAFSNVGSIDMTGAELARNGAGIQGIDTGVLLSGVTFEDTGAFGVSVSGGSVDVRESSFSGNVGTTVYSETREDGSVHTWETTGGGVDVYAEAAPVVVETVTCTDGDRGVVLGAGATALVTDVMFSGYTQQVLASEGGTIDALRVTAMDTAGDAIVCTDGEMSLDKVTLDGVSTWVAETAYSVDGSWVSDTSEVRVDPALRGLRCTLFADDLAVKDVAGQPVRWWNGVFEADGFVVDGALSGLTDPEIAAIELAWTERAPAAVLESATISNLYRGNGVSISVAADLEPGFVELNGVTVTSPPGDGVVLAGGTTRLAGLTVTGAGEYGMTCDADVPPAFAACDVSLDGAMGDALDCSGCP